MAGSHSRSRCSVPLACALSLAFASCGGAFRLSGGGGTGGGGGFPLPADPLSIPLSFSVQNDSASTRTETIRASIPFPQGGYTSLANVAVAGHPTAWHVMQHWPDGTIRMAQAQFTDTLPGSSQRSYQITRNETALAGGFVHNPWVAAFGGGIALGAEVKDTFNVTYRAFATGAGEVVQSTPLVQVTRYRRYHQVVGGSGGIGRDYLTSTFYVTEYRDMPIVLVDWLLGNDYLGGDSVAANDPDPNKHPLGVIDVMSAGFLVQGTTDVIAYLQAQEQIGAATDLGGGLTRFTVMQNTYLGDGQNRRYRFMVRVLDPGASAGERAAWTATGNAMFSDPLYPLATIGTWQETAGAGLLGGPIDGPADATSRAVAEYQGWLGTNWFGTWGSHGEVVHTGTTGTPRNTPLSGELAHAIQGNYPRLLQKLEQIAWVQAMRAYHMYGLQVGAEQDIMLWDGIPLFPGSRDLSPESMGRRALWAADPYAGYRTQWPLAGETIHGWEPFDHEHWSNDSLFDYWSISDDAWAQEELRQIGQSLKGLMRLRNAFTAGIQAARAEGWTMQGFAQVYVATGDPSIKDYAIRRAAEVIDVQRQKNHPSRVMTVQADYPQTGYPTPNLFYMPWQHGAVLYGYLGAYRHMVDPLLLRIAEDVTSTVEYSWVKNFNDAYLGFIPEGLRYYAPFAYNGVQVPVTYWDRPPTRAHFGDSPLGGAHVFLVAGLYMLADWSGNGSVRQKALHYASLLCPTTDDNSRWDKWHYCVPLNRLP